MRGGKALDDEGRGRIIYLSQPAERRGGGQPAEL